jgi:SAM-dependent methyltransferase
LSGLSTGDWHRRFEIQAGWTREVQEHIFSNFPVGPGSRLLEVGCGTGALIASLNERFPACYTGIDLDGPRLEFARQILPRAAFIREDGASLPFPSGSFDGAFCHFLLLWTAAPVSILAEMTRVTKPGGLVAALAEPDYGARIDHPAQLAELGRLQRRALKAQGADPDMGRKLGGLFAQAGLANVQSGILGARWQMCAVGAEFESEWEVLESDLSAVVSPADLARWKAADLAARETGQRVLFVPTFYAVGEVR